jgi:hypothetical protein
VGLQPQVDKLIGEIADADKAREGWGDNQRKFTRQRYGLRLKKKTIPWKGASNLNVPLADKAVRRWKPGIVRLTHDATPVAHFFATGPEDTESARKAEIFYDWLFKWKMDSLDEVVYLADIVAQRGLAFVETAWEYRTERMARVVRTSSIFPQGVPRMQQTGEPDLAAISQTLIQQYNLSPDRPDHMRAIATAAEGIADGIQALKIVYRQVVEDRPELVVHDPIKVVVPARETNIKNSNFICIQNIMTKDDLRRMATDEVLEVAAVEKVIDTIESRSDDMPDAMGVTSPGQIIREDRDSVDELTGILQVHEKPDTIEVWRIYTWLDINNDGERERVVLWLHPGTKTILAIMEYVAPFSRWPIVQFDFEKTHSKRIYSSRGIVQLLSALQVEINKLHNSRIDAVSIQLAPVFLVRSTGNLTRTLRWAPGTGLPVQSPDDIRPLIQDFRNLSEYMREEQFVRLIAEEYVGIFDAALGSATNPAERRTATEVEAIQAQISGIFNLDAMLWQKSWRDVHALIFALWRELGEEEVFVRVIGQDQPLQVLKHEIDKNFDIQPAGTPTNTNKAIELARAREVIQLMWNPFTFQTGLIDAQKLLDWYFTAHDYRRAKQIVRSPEQAAEQQEIMAAAAELSQGGMDELMGGGSQVSGQRAGANARGVT